MEYRASVRSTGPIRRTHEWPTTDDLQKAKAWAESHPRVADDVVEVVGFTSYPSMDSVSEVWRLVDGEWIDASFELRN